MGEEAVVFYDELIYKENGEERRAIKCLDEELNWFSHYDCESGIELSGMSIYSSLRFIEPTCPLPPVPNRLPYVYIKRKTDLVTIDRCRDVEAAPEDALYDCDFVALLLGLRCEGRLFLETRNGSFSDIENKINVLRPSVFHQRICNSNKNQATLTS